MISLIAAITFLTLEYGKRILAATGGMFALALIIGAAL